MRQTNSKVITINTQHTELSTNTMFVCCLLMSVCTYVSAPVNVTQKAKEFTNLKDSWPGVSIINRPGNRRFNLENCT